MFFAYIWHVWRCRKGNGGIILRQIIVRVADIGRTNLEHLFRMRPGKPERVRECKQGNTEGDKIWRCGVIRSENRPHMLFVKKVWGQRFRRKISGSWAWRHIRIDTGDPSAALFQQRADALVEAVHIGGRANEHIASGKVKGISGDHGVTLWIWVQAGGLISRNHVYARPFVLGSVLSELLKLSWPSQQR